MTTCSANRSGSAVRYAMSQRFDFEFDTLLVIVPACVFPGCAGRSPLIISTERYRLYWFRRALEPISSSLKDTLKDKKQTANWTPGPHTDPQVLLLDRVTECTKALHVAVRGRRWGKFEQMRNEVPLHRSQGISEDCVRIWIMQSLSNSTQQSL